MSTHRFTLAAVTTLALAGLPILGCATTPARTNETAGEWIDNSVITTRVKSAILGDPALKSFQINVKSFKDTVQLSGFVDSSAAAAQAGRVAAGVEGVKAVKNDLIVK
jgi:osmotically-inducible protein OsmY